MEYVFYLLEILKMYLTNFKFDKFGKLFSEYEQLNVIVDRTKKSGGWVENFDENFQQRFENSNEIWICTLTHSPPTYPYQFDDNAN